MSKSLQEKMLTGAVKVREKTIPVFTFRNEILLEGEGDGRLSGARQAREPDGAASKRPPLVQLLASLRPRDFVLLLEHVGRLVDLAQVGPGTLQAFFGDLHDSIGQKEDVSRLMLLLLRRSKVVTGH